MRHRPLRIPITVALLATAGMVVAAGGNAAPGSAAARPAARTPAATGAGGAARSILMINGDRLLAASAAGGPRVLGILPGAAGPAGRLIGVGLGSTALEIPVVALPYLGRGLAPGLFEPSALARAESGGRLPVTVTYQGKVPALPGVTITGAGGGTASGYLTATGAVAFGAALARQFTADHGADSYGRDGIFAGGVSVGLAGGPAGAARAALAPRHAPRFRMHTLTVTGTDLAGLPDTGDVVFVFDADNAQRYADPVESISEFDHGVVKFSVPAGHLWALGIFMPVAHGKPVPATRTVVIPQIDASGERHRAHGRTGRGQRGPDGDAAAVGAEQVQPARRDTASHPGLARWATSGTWAGRCISARPPGGPRWGRCRCT